jgi:AraC-like DNA-binding protein
MEYEVGPGMAMVLHFPCDNRYWLPRGWGPWEFVYTCMNGAEVLRAWQEIERAAGPIIRCEAGSSPVVLVSQLYEDAMKSRIATPFDASSRAYQMAMALEQVAYHRNAGTNRPAGISRVIDFCQANFRGAIGIDDLAAVSGFSRYHFCRTFRRIEGITPLDHLTGVRIRHAAQLLAGGMHSVKEAAFESGFSEPNYFCKVFRKKMGIAPGEFRRSGMYSSAH